jgi:hypothetical protein
VTVLCEPCSSLIASSGLRYRILSAMDFRDSLLGAGSLIARAGADLLSGIFLEHQAAASYPMEGATRRGKKSCWPAGAVADRWRRCARGFRNGRSSSRADGLACAARVRAPLLVIENSADNAVPQPHSKMPHDAALSTEKTFHVVKGATHYYAGQPALLAEATSLIFDWLSARCMGMH